MSLKEREERAKALAGKPSRRDLILKVIEKRCPVRHAAMVKSMKTSARSGGPGPGRWGPGKWTASGWTPDDPKTQAPYILEELDDGTWRVRVEAEDGDIIGGVGKTADEAVAALVQKVIPPTAEGG